MTFRLVDGSLFWTRFNANTHDLLSTPDDVATDVMMHLERAYGVAFWAPLWYQYLNTNGKKGIKPPPLVMQIDDWWLQMRRTTDDAERIELGKNIVRTQAENLWGIGTVGRQWWPIIVHHRLKNVPKEGLWGWAWLVTYLHRPDQFYLETDLAN